MKNAGAGQVFFPSGSRTIISFFYLNYGLPFCRYARR